MAPLTDKGVIKWARFSIETCDGSPVAYVISSPIIVGYHKRLWSHSVTEREIHESLWTEWKYNLTYISYKQNNVIIIDNKWVFYL